MLCLTRFALGCKKKNQRPLSLFRKLGKYVFLHSDDVETGANRVCVYMDDVCVRVMFNACVGVFILIQMQASFVTIKINQALAKRTADLYSCGSISVIGRWEEGGTGGCGFWHCFCYWQSLLGPFKGI